jgi:protein TonB
MMAATVDIVDLRRWLLSALVVLGLHASTALLLLHWHEPITGAEPTDDAITVDLAPFTTPKSESSQDLAPGPELQETAPEPAADEPQQQPAETSEIPPVAEAEVTLPKPEEAEQPQPIPQPSAAAPAAPPRQRTASRAEVQSWYRRILTQLERHKGYPAVARARGQTGIVEIAFTIDRTGRVQTSRILQSSGSRSLDGEALATLRRAQPFPAPPPDLSGATFDFTVPIRFNIR